MYTSWPASEKQGRLFSKMDLLIASVGEPCATAVLSKWWWRGTLIGSSSGPGSGQIYLPGRKYYKSRIHQNFCFYIAGHLI